MNPNQKRVELSKLTTEVIRNIVNNYTGTESATKERPLAGQVAIKGIGSVPIRWLKEELRLRRESN